MKRYTNDDGVLSVEVSVDSWHTVMAMVTGQVGLERIHTFLGDDGVSYTTGFEFDGENKAWEFVVQKCDWAGGEDLFSLGKAKRTEERFSTVAEAMEYLKAEKVLPKREPVPEWFAAWREDPQGMLNKGKEG